MENKKMTILESYNTQIWVGLRVGYTDEVHTLDEVRDLCDQYVNEIKDCVTITPTEFRYVDGNEPGVIVGYINYPRFPRTQEEIYGRTLQLAEILMYGLGQNRVTITTPDRSIMLEAEKPDEKG